MFKARVLGALGLSLSILLFISVLTYKSAVRGATEADWVSHTHLVLEAIADVRASAVEAESNERGYIITGDQRYSAPFQAALDLAHKRVADLRRLTSDNPVQQKNLDSLEPEINLRFAVLAQVTDLRKTQGFQAASRAVLQGTGQQAMDDIRTSLAAMDQEEQSLLESRNKEATASSARTKKLIVGGNIISFLLLFFAGGMIYQEMERRRTSEETVRQLNANLEDRVAERTADLAERTDELARSNQELQQFAYVASHDLQEPLRMVASFTQLLAKRYNDKLGDDAREFIAFAVDGANRLQTLISDLLTYSRVGTQAKPLEITDANGALRRVLSHLQLAIKDNRATITFDPLPNVMADEVQLCQLFQNLLTNAMKFHGEQPPRIHVSAAREGDHWKFQVRDNGIGIAPEHADRIWVIFQRLHTKTEYPGTGIGLAICKKIVERHGGRIWVEQAPEGGSNFCFTVPLAEPIPSMEETADHERRHAVAAH